MSEERESYRLGFVSHEGLIYMGMGSIGALVEEGSRQETVLLRNGLCRESCCLWELLFREIVVSGSRCLREFAGDVVCERMIRF